jgi:phenylpyruvate tautomerase PptA (4-oxalocrotonate tautomerase family)
MIRGITNVFVELGVPESTVEVIVYEIPKTLWGIGGEPASKKLKNVSHLSNIMPCFYVDCKFSLYLRP